jgi:hypothetical protein
LFLFFIVLRPCLVAGPVQGPGSRFWLGHQVLTGSPGQFFFFKSKRRRFSKKKKQKSTGLQPGLDRILLGHTGFFLPPFFLQPGPVPAPGRPGPGSTCRARPGFKTMVYDLSYIVCKLSRETQVNLIFFHLDIFFKKNANSILF